MAQAVTVTSPLGEGKLLFRSLSGREELGRLFEFKLELLSENGALALDKILGQNVTIAAEFPDDRKRYFNGDVAQFRQVTRSVDKYFCYEAVLRPRLWFLTQTRDCKIFQNKTVPEIIKLVLDEPGITDVKRSLSRTYNPREYCVQYNESDFDFLSRLMEEEGIYYYFEHASGKHTLVLADSLSAHESLPRKDTLPFMSRKGGYAEDHVYDWNLQQRALPVAWAHKDFDFTKPRADLKSQSKIGRTHGQAGLEVFAWPGGYQEKADGTAIARTRIEEVQTPWEIASGKTTAVTMAAGRLFKLSGYARSDQNREHLVIAAEYDVKMETDTAAAAGTDVLNSKAGVFFDCRFEAISSQRPFRTACTTPKPAVKGPQTALVVGKNGEEIWTDQYGRVKVQFHWDRLGQNDENSSCWLRVAQVWAGKEWGGIHIPRIGQEVIVDFLEGDPDQPIITGRVYNAEQKVPYALPANMTQSGLKTRSSKAGDAATFNELRFEDKKGEEQVYFHAEKNFDRVVENNDTLKVGFDKKDKGNQTVEIYNDRTATLEKGTDKLQVKEGNRIALIDKGNDELKISQGNLTITINGGKGTIEACQELLLKVGESTIKITPSGIELNSVNVKANANGQFEAKATMAKIAGSGMLDLDGGAITIN
jgi:type VI secretion system secreted protein VgrG